MSSFQKRRTTPLLPGGKQSLHTGQQIVSSGNPAFDYILGKQKTVNCSVVAWSLFNYFLINYLAYWKGGGLPIGSIVLIEEDEFGRYSKYLTKLFLAEGTVHKHAIFVANFDNDPQETVCCWFTITFVCKTFWFHWNNHIIIIISTAKKIIDEQIASNATWKAIGICIVHRHKWSAKWSKRWNAHRMAIQ